MSDEGGNKKFQGTEVHFVMWDILFKGQTCSNARDTTSNCTEQVALKTKSRTPLPGASRLQFAGKVDLTKLGMNGNAHCPFPIGSLKHTGSPPTNMWVWFTKGEAKWDLSIK